MFILSMFVYELYLCLFLQIQSSNEKRLDHKLAVALGEEEKLSSKYLRANSHLIRAKR